MNIKQRLYSGEGRKLLRLGLLFSIIATIWLVGHLSGATAGITPITLRASLLSAGALGIVAYVVSFALGNLIQVPGLIFLMGGLLTYGPVEGSAVALLGSLTAISTSFIFARAVGGQLEVPDNKPRIKRILSRLDTSPVRTMIVLRLILWTSPPLNYALALSSVRYPQYILAAAIGMVPPIIMLATLTDQIMHLKGWT
jgi:uncharacterized membrane protein YdjX (TVP38/TMEM64 family)